MKFSDLLEVIVTKDSLEYVACISKARKMNFIIVLDLSKPFESWTHLNHFISLLESSIKRVLEHGKAQTNEDTRKIGSSHIWKGTASTHQDCGLLTILPVPIIIIGSKYDLFLVGCNKSNIPLETQIRGSRSN